MKKAKYGKVKRFLRKRGFAVALVFSLVAVGASTFIAYDRAISKISLPDLEISTSDELINFDLNPAAQVGQNVDNIPKEQPEPEVVDLEAQANENSEEAGNFVAPQPPRIMPVEGEVYEDFSAGELRKSKTLGVWKTHDGIDIAAPLGTPVLSMTNGTVAEVFSEPLWGICVIIDHGDGVFGHYYGLDKNVLVSVGQTVNAGDEIAKVGNTAEVEIADPPHLHFAVKKNDVWVDPLEFIQSVR
ncbi:MAG: M23 family metallopeptidase [Oscillospiraceae bacterium]|nr:M23 family metallopeptidase [Oscillospiraceae bacterium]